MSRASCQREALEVTGHVILELLQFKMMQVVEIIYSQQSKKLFLVSSLSGCSAERNP